MADPTRTRSLSIYLLKVGFDGDTALIPEHRLGEPVDDATTPIGSTLYVFDGKEREPWWKLYFGIKRDLKQASKAALMFLKVESRTFALCFGHVAHNLRDESYEYDFGLRITLNAVDPKKLKNTDTIEPGAARRQRTQVSVDSDLTFFDFESDASVLRSLTGTVKPEFSDLIKNVTGSSNLRISTKTRVGDIPALCRSLIDLYESDAFKTAFPEIQNVTPVRDPAVVDTLDAALIDALRAGSTDPLLAVPELVEFNDSFWLSFSGAGRSDLHHDIFLQLYYDYLSHNAFVRETLDLETLKRHKLLLLNDDTSPRTAHSIYKSLMFSTEVAADTAIFHLMEGNWFRFEREFVDRINSQVEPSLAVALVPDCTFHLEGDYNDDAPAHLDVAVCLDKTNMSPVGQTQVEPCDVLVEEAGTAVFVHVKFSTASAQLSHLFNQGANSMQLLKSVEEVAAKLRNIIRSKATVANAEKLIELLDQNNVAVQYAIVTHKDPSRGVDNLPLFSRMSLARALRAFRAMNIPVTLAFVPDLSPDRPGEPKPRKKRTPQFE